MSLYRTNDLSFSRLDGKISFQAHILMNHGQNDFYSVIIYELTILEIGILFIYTPIRYDNVNLQYSKLTFLAIFYM